MKNTRIFVMIFLFLFILSAAGNDQEIEIIEEERVELRHGIPVGVSGKSYGERAMDRLVIQVLGTDAEAVPERINDYLYRLRTRMITDPNFFLYQVEAAYDGEKELVTLEGNVVHPFHLDITGIVFERLGFEVENNIQLLPDRENLGETLFAVQTVTSAYVYDKPDSRSEVMTQGLYGHYYFLLKKTGDYFLVHTDEGYIGYIHADNLELYKENEFTKYLNSPKAFVLKAFQVGDLSLSPGSELRFLKKNNDSYTVQLLDGQELSIPERVVLPPLEEKAHKIASMLEFGKTYLGVGYDWGGKSDNGIDCSGFTQMLYRSIGIHLPRDSFQQFMVGRLVATPWYISGLQAGDTLFFVSSNTGRIGHVAVSMDSNAYIHAQSPLVEINSLASDDEDYLSMRFESFIYGKRPYAR